MRRRALLLPVVCLSICVPSVAQSRYSVIDLGTLGAGQNSLALAVNNRGQVVGWSENRLFSTYHHAFAWDSRNGMRDLGTLSELPGIPPGDQSEATAINESGTVAGWSTIVPGDPGTVEARSFLLDGSGTLQDIGVTDLGGFTNYAYGINGSGRVAGASRTGDALNGWPYHPYLWSKQDGMTDLGAPPAFLMAFSQGINDRGQSVGYGILGSYAYHALLWGKNGGSQDLGTFPDGFYSFAAALNNNGLIVGTADTSVTLDIFGFPITQDASRAAAWTVPGGITELGALPGGYNSSASSVNNRGDVVGSSDTFNPTTGAYTTHAFLVQNGNMMDLNNLIDPTPGIEITDARGISDTGYIVGQASIANGFKHHAVLLIPRK